MMKMIQQSDKAPAVQTNCFVAELSWMNENEETVKTLSAY